MSTLEWSDALSLDLPEMDDTHREFVVLLAAVENAADAQIEATWRELIAHTDDHFGREDRWMRDTRYASSNCHSTQHLVVLKVMREIEAMVREDKPALIRQVARELAQWFPQHAQGMDAALALHLRGVGYDAASGIVAMPEALPAEAITGCGSVACSPRAAEAGAGA
ncbi:MAG: hemerythrin domain-containing protein [Burkholderiales bacterium]